MRLSWRRGRWTFAISISGLILFAVAVASLTVAALTGRGEAREKDRARISVLIATGMPGGTYYRVGLGMASLWTTKLRETGIRVSAAISEGSRENIEAIRIADADLILAENLFCTMAYNGTGIYKARSLPELRSITTLWPDTVHLLIRSDMMHTATLQDLEGRTLSTGLPESENKFTTQLLLKTLKSGKHEVRLRSMSYASAAEALKNGTIQALDVTGGIPVPLVSALLNEARPPLGFLEITDGQMEAVRAEGWKDVFRIVIPPETYPGQEKPVRTVGLMNVLATTASLDSQVVYALTSSLYENLDYLSEVHPACRSIVLSRALEGLTVPLHPGAARYYREKKIDIPRHLIP